MMTFNGKSETSLSSPNKSDDGADILLDAWRIALAETLDAQQERWEQHIRLMEAQSSAIIARLEAKVATLDGLSREKIDARLAELKDGRDGERGPPGEKGETGEQGEPGERGLEGPRGEQGPAGDKGDKGDPGEKGIPGERGVQGDRGDPGEPGQSGPIGERGEKGDKGDGGERGPAGEPGDRGQDGPEGPRGEKGDPGADGRPGQSGEKGDRGSDGEKGEKGDQGQRGEIGQSGIRGDKGERGEKGDPGQNGEHGHDGLDGQPGQLTAVKDFLDEAIHYKGDVVAHKGGTYQAKRDTAKEPPHKDWTCLAAPGHNAQMPVIRGTYRDDETYTFLNIVALGGSSFIARADNPGSCPGDGWQLIASAGKPGKPGQRGERGPVGPISPWLKEWRIDRKNYTATPIMSDGSELESLQLRSLFEQYNEES